MITVICRHDPDLVELLVRAKPHFVRELPEMASIEDIAREIPDIESEVFSMMRMLGFRSLDLLVVDETVLSTLKLLKLTERFCGVKPWLIRRERNGAG